MKRKRKEERLKFCLMKNAQREELNCTSAVTEATDGCCVRPLIELRYGHYDALF